MKPKQFDKLLRELKAIARVRQGACTGQDMVRYAEHANADFILAMIDRIEELEANTQESSAAQGATVDELGKYREVLVPFLSLMATELRANAGKGDRPGWLAMSRQTGMLEIYYHTAKLQKAVRDDDTEHIKEHAADVANMCMMILDICGGLEVAQPSDATAQPSEEIEALALARVTPLPAGVIAMTTPDSDTRCGQFWPMGKEPPAGEIGIGKLILDAAQPRVDLTDERAWQIAVDLFGTVLRDTRKIPHIEIYSADMAGQLARALIAAYKGEQP